MSTSWSNQSKSASSYSKQSRSTTTWNNQSKSVSPTTDYLLLIDDTYQFLIDDTYSLSIETIGGGASTVWSNQSKS